MTPVIRCSLGHVYPFPQTTTCTSRKENRFTKFNSFGKSPRRLFPSQCFLLPRCSRLFPKYVDSGNQILAAVETDVAVEEASSATEDEDSSKREALETSTESSEVSSTQSTRSRPARKSEMPPVKNEELISGATFTGKVRSVQPFGAFVDFGAFTDGLVHVSRLSDSFVKDVSNVVSVGQEVHVRILEVNTETGRISLSMRESDDPSKLQERKDASAKGTSERPRPSRKNASKTNQKREEVQKTSKFVKGQLLDGTVKNLTRAGAFVSLPEGEEGFLPTSEQSDGLYTVLGSSSLQVGQEVKVRVLRFNRGSVTLTMKKEGDNSKLNVRLEQGVIHLATNPFLLAFRENKDIAAFLDERENVQKTKTSEKVEEKVVQNETESEVVEITAEEVEGIGNEAVPPNETSDLELSYENEVTSEAPVINEVKEEISPTIPPTETGDQISLPQSHTTEEAPTSDAVKDETLESQFVDKVSPSESDLTEATGAGQSSEASVENLAVTEMSQHAEEEAPSTTLEDIKAETSSHKQNGNSATSSSQQETSSGDSIKAASSVSPALVKQLREETGAGMMDCKKALSETGGDLVKAQEYLRKKGLASAEKKASRATAEGRIGSYIHDNRIGVLIEVNCETDFVSRGDIFKELVDDLAMQVAACPQVSYLSIEDVPEEIVNKEREIEMQKEDLLSKPEQIRSKIVDGRIRKRLEEFALLEQPYIKNDKMVVKDWVKQTIATIGENIKVRRFARFNLGEGLEKKRVDFAAEVAAQTAAKQSMPGQSKDPSATEAKETVEKPTVAISAALVKQLREETGAGMMDCKKALTETGGDLEKAQEYLRKKGLSSADKKSSRLAAEGKISSYIHDTRIGVLIEVNCETDFVGRSENFKELVDDLAMQVVACPQVQLVSIEEIPESIVSKEKELEMQREDLQSKPENIREKIVEGRISKRLGELALLEQPFIKDDGVLVKDLVKQTVAAIGENMKVRRFIRYTLGEPIENEKIQAEV